MSEERDGKGGKEREMETENEERDLARQAAKINETKIGNKRTKEREIERDREREIEREREKG